MPHKRERRCSLSAAVASLSINPRSHCSPLSVICESQEEDLAIALADAQWHERRAVAGSAPARAARGVVYGPVRRAYQIASVGAEELPFAPVQFQSNVAAAVQVAPHRARKPHHEGRRGLAEVIDLEAHAAADLHQRRGIANQPYFVSHRASS